MTDAIRLRDLEARVRDLQRQVAVWQSAVSIWREKHDAAQQEITRLRAEARPGDGRLP